MNHSTTSSTSLSLRPKFSNLSSNQSDISISSAQTTTKHNHYNFSTQLITNKSWIKIQVDSIRFDLKNDEYEIKLSDSHIMSFDFAGKSCCLRMPSDKIQINRGFHDENDTENYEDNDIDAILKEIHDDSNGLQIENIQSEWDQLQQVLSQYESNNTPKVSDNNNQKTHKPKPSHFHYNACPFSIEQCPHIQHIMFILSIYNKYINYKTKQQLYNSQDINKLPHSVTHIVNSLKNYDKIKLLNDYLHIKKQHYNINEFQELQSYIKTKIVACQDTKTCICCNRNRENNELYKNLQSKTRRDLYLISDSNFQDGSVEEMHEINLQKTIDTIHSTLIHQMLSDDKRYKFTTHLTNNTNLNNYNGRASMPVTPIINFAIDENEEEQDEQEEEKMKEGLGGSEYDFSINGETSDNESDSSFYNATEYMHQFGESFSYWNPKYDDYIAPKYTDLKTELLCQGMNQNDYKILHLRCIDFLQCQYAQNMNCRRQFSWMYKKVKIGQKITINHMMALMIYTNYISFKNLIINNACKRQSQHETMQQFKQRHCEIAHFVRLLKEAIHCFGDSMTDKSRLYHGIDCKLMFNTVDFSFNIPISSTIKYSIAPITNNGICLKFGKPILSNQKNYYFDVSDLSQFPDEKERITFGGDALGFLDIIYNGHSHCEQIMSLRLFQQIIQGNWFTNNKELMKTKYQRRIIKFINAIINVNHANNQNYVMELFKNLAILPLKNDHAIWINKQEMQLCLPELSKIFFHKFEHYLIKTYNLNVKYCDILEMQIAKQDIEISSFRKSIYSKLYTYSLNNKGEKVSFVFRCFQKYDKSRDEHMFRGFIAIKYLPKSNVVNSIEMRYGLYFPQKIKLTKWETCILSPNNLYKGNSLFTLNEIKNIDMLHIKVCFQIIKVQ